jgi:hypothetical protein
MAIPDNTVRRDLDGRVSIYSSVQQPLLHVKANLPKINAAWQ